MIRREELRCFYPHAHEGRDVAPCLAHTGGCSFYPHAHEGRDREGVLPRGLEVVSTHTPMKGVTEDGLVCVPDHSVSTHTPVKGVTHLGVGLSRGSEFLPTRP